MTGDADPSCPFCAIVARRTPASIVREDELTMAFIDARQFHAGHVLVIPRRHVADIRALEGPDGEAIGAALGVAVARVARAVESAFPLDGISVWQSAGPGANQEVPHLHVHVHPRRAGDGLLRVYPSSPATPDRATLDGIAGRLRAAL